MDNEPLAYDEEVELLAGKYRKEVFRLSPCTYFVLGLLSTECGCDPLFLLAPLLVAVTASFPNNVVSEGCGTTKLKDVLTALHIALVAPSASGKSRALGVLGPVLDAVSGGGLRVDSGTVPAIVKKLAENDGRALSVVDEMFSLLHHLYTGGVGDQAGQLAMTLSLLSGNVPINKSYAGNGKDSADISIPSTNWCSIMTTQPWTMQTQLRPGDGLKNGSGNRIVVLMPLCCECPLRPAPPCIDPKERVSGWIVTALVSALKLVNKQLTMENSAQRVVHMTRAATVR